MPHINIQGSILGLDWGEKKVGIATADSKGIALTAHNVFRRKAIPSKDFWILTESDKEFLAALLLEYECTNIVLGQPTGLKGQETEGSQGAQRLQLILRKEFQKDVHLVNESLTSWEINEKKENLSKSKKEHFDKNKDSYVAVRLIEIFLNNSSF